MTLSLASSVVDLALVLERAGAVDDARQALRQHAERDAHAGDQEHRTQRELDQVRDVFGLQVDPGHGAEVCHTSRACANADDDVYSVYIGDALMYTVYTWHTRDND